MNSAKSPAVRNEVIDISKGIGIILVVIGHNFMLKSMIPTSFEVIYSFHMPLFFFLSGIYIKSKSNFKDFFFNRCDALLKPYLSALILLSIFYCSYNLPALTKFFLGGLIGTATSLDIHALPLWFLPTLFFTSIISWTLLNLKKFFKLGDLSYFFILILLLASGIFTIKFSLPTNANGQSSIASNAYWFSQNLPWGIELVPLTSAYFLLGHALKEKILNFSWNSYIFLLALAAFIALFAYSAGTMDLAQSRYDGVWSVTAKSLIGIYLVISISKAVTKNLLMTKLFSALGRASITIFLFHSAIQTTILDKFITYNFSWRKSGVAAFFASILLTFLFHEIILKSNFLSAILLSRKKSSGPMPDESASIGAPL